MARCVCAWVALLIGLAAPAAAETEALVGAGVGVRPDYPGSDDYRAEALPALRLKWSGEAAKPPDDGTRTSFGIVDATAGFPHGVSFGVARVATPERQVTLRVGAGYRHGRDADDNPALRGMGDVRGQPVLRLKLESEPTADTGSFFGLGWESDVSGETRGDAVTLYGGRTFAPSEAAAFTLTAHTRWFDADDMAAYFGVSPAQAAASGHPAFAPGRGLGDAGLAAELRWAFTDNWSVFGTVGVSRLLGDAADGPLVDDAGSATQFRAGTGVSFRF